MTDHFLQDLAQVLADRLSESASAADDFVRLASAGEPLRRAVALLDTVPSDVASMLASYDAALTAYSGPVPATLDADASAVASDLEAYRGAEDEDGDIALALILDLDAITATTVAAERTGRMPNGTVDALAARLEQTLAGVSSRAPHLAQLAEDRWLTVGDDPDLTGAYGWLDVLAEAAPSRARTAAVVNASAEHERRVDEALRILSRVRPATRARSSIGRMPRSADAHFAPPSLFATSNVAIPKQQPLVEDEELSVFLEATRETLHLVVAFAPPLWIDDVRATLDAVALPRVDGGRHEFRFSLPDRGGQLHLELQIEDEVVTHDLELRRPT